MKLLKSDGHFRLVALVPVEVLPGVYDLKRGVLGGAALIVFQVTTGCLQLLQTSRSPLPPSVSIGRSESVALGSPSSHTSSSSGRESWSALNSPIRLPLGPNGHALL